MHIRTLWSDLPGKISVSTTRIETGSDGCLYAVQKTKSSYLDQKNHTRSIKQQMAAWQRDVRKEMADQGKSLDYLTESSNAVFRGPTPLKPVELKFAIRAPAPQLPTRATSRRSNSQRFQAVATARLTLKHLLMPTQPILQDKTRFNKALECITRASKDSLSMGGKRSRLITDRKRHY